MFLKGWVSVIISDPEYNDKRQCPIHKDLPLKPISNK